jgi:hypothetical protein
MSNLLATTIIATFLLLRGASAQTERSPMQPRQEARPQNVALQPDTIAAVLERCWRAEEIKAGHSTSFSSSSSNFDQVVGLFRGDVHLRWCRTSLEAWGPVEHHGKRDYLARIDSLTLRLQTDTIILELRERADEPTRLMVNGHAATTDWWRAGSRERVLRLAGVPLL